MGMSIRQAGIAAGLLAGAYLAGGVVGLVVVALFVVGPVYAASLWRHPNRNCWACRGSGQHRGWLYDYARRPCTSCAGTGTKQRWGRRVFFPSNS